MKLETINLLKEQIDLLELNFLISCHDKVNCKARTLNAFVIITLYQALIKCDTDNDAIVIMLIDDITNKSQYDFFWSNKIRDRTQPRMIIYGYDLGHPLCHNNNSIYQCIEDALKEIPEPIGWGPIRSKSSRLKKTLNNVILELKGIKNFYNSVDSMKQTIVESSDRDKYQNLCIKSARK